MTKQTLWSLKMRGLRHKLTFVFALVMIAVLVFLGYLFPVKSSLFELKVFLPQVVLLAVLVILLAFFWVKQIIINPVIRMSGEAKKIADGDYTRHVDAGEGDEIGELGQALNRMTVHIKENMEELKVFSQKSEAVNEEINKRILSLSSLLQVSHLISENATINEVIEAILARCLTAGKTNLSCLILRDRQGMGFSLKAIHGPGRGALEPQAGELRFKLGDGLLGRAMLRQESIILDKNSKGTPEEKDFLKQFELKNAVVQPVISRGKIHGLLIVGNNSENYLFSNADFELYDLLSKQLAIAIENALLLTKVEKLEIIDHLTGLFNKSFVEERLEEEIKRAIGFQRPCTFVLFSVDQFEEYRKAFGHIPSEDALIKISRVLQENIKDVDKAARFSDYEFALILPERNKRQGIEIAEDIRKKIELKLADNDAKKCLTVTGAVSENPLDGVTAAELIAKARHILRESQEQGSNKISYKIS